MRLWVQLIIIYDKLFMILTIILTINFKKMQLISKASVRMGPRNDSVIQVPVSFGSGVPTCL